MLVKRSQNARPKRVILEGLQSRLGVDESLQRVPLKKHSLLGLTLLEEAPVLRVEHLDVVKVPLL